MPAEAQHAVLVVDDEPGIRSYLARVLRNAGYVIVEAQDGLDAWNQFRRQPDRFDLLLTDVVMPKVPGTELAARVHELRPELPVIIMTGYTPTELLKRGLQASHGELLTKPLDPGRLLATVRKALG